MLEIQKYLMSHSLEELKETYGVEAKVYDDCVLLNYSQIDSPKEEMLVRECRGLILSKDYKHILCKSFTRFFNYGECQKSQEGFSFNDAVVYEKVDGSIIRIWWNHFIRNWCIASRGMAYAEGLTSTAIHTFHECVMKCFGEGEWEKFCSYLNPNFTYVFEFVSPENRVVKSYGSDYHLYFLACFDNRTGKEERGQEEIGNTVIELLGEFDNIRHPKVYSLKNYSEIVDFMSSLDTMDEGFVVYDKKSGIRVKIKNPSYLAIASKRMNGGLTENAIIDMVYANETAEYLTYFHEDFHLIEPYMEAYERMMNLIHKVWNDVRFMDTSDAEGRKMYASRVKEYPFSGLLFSMKDGKEMKDILARMSDNSKKSMLLKFM